MILEFDGKIFIWRGPAPYFFVAVPEAQCENLRAVASIVSYGWGVIPVQARIGKTVWKTSLFPKDGGYLVPIKDMVRKAEDLLDGEEVRVRLEVRL